MSALARENLSERPAEPHLKRKNGQPLPNTVIVLTTVKVALPKKSLFFGIAVSFAMLFLTLSRYGTIAEMNLSLGRLNRQYAEVKEHERILKVQVESRLQLDLIRVIAMEKYGLRSPDAHQIVPVSVQKSSRSVIQNASYVGSVVDTQQTVVAKVAGAVNDLLP